MKALTRPFSASGTSRSALCAWALAACLAASTVLQAADVEWNPDIYPSDNLFPSVVIGTARVNRDEELFPAWEGHHLGDTQGILGAVIGGLKKGDKIKLVVKGNEFMKESRIDEKIDEDSDEDLVVHPKIAYDYEHLASVTQATPLDITMELFVNGESVGEKTATVTLRSINDCLFGVKEAGEEDEESTSSDYSWLFAAYVNENHPWVDRLLKEALETGIVSSFTGYQSNDEETVLLQIFAIWNVMQRRGMKYSDITTTAAESDGVYSQHVRLFDESIEASQANCVDGTVLLAALLRKIGLHPSLVIIPGHMFLAVDLSDESIIGIETTLMGENSLDKIDRKKFPSFEKLAPKLQEAAWKSFEGAVASGTETLEDNAKKIESDDLQYQIIDLTEARRMGILPIKFKGTAERKN